VDASGRLHAARHEFGDKALHTREARRMGRRGSDRRRRAFDQIYEAGYKIKYVPYAVTWEQEPERLRSWFRQRSRWVAATTMCSSSMRGGC